MELADFIDETSAIADLKVSSKKQLLSVLAEEASRRLSLEERDVFDTLLQREKLGSTGIGGGVAIPHGKLRDIDGVFGMIAVLHKPIAYDAVDDNPVDIIFLLLAPESAGADHLKALARIARFVRSDGVTERLRAALTSDAIRLLVQEAPKLDAA